VSSLAAFSLQAVLLNCRQGPSNPGLEDHPTGAAWTDSSCPNAPEQASTLGANFLGRFEHLMLLQVRLLGLGMLLLLLLKLLLDSWWLLLLLRLILLHLLLLLLLLQLVLLPRHHTAVTLRQVPETTPLANLKL
jgi:hypothetical protein